MKSTLKVILRVLLKVYVPVARVTVSTAFSFTQIFAKFVDTNHNCALEVKPEVFSKEMSLFKVCDWWTTQCSDLDENYDVASLLCARFGLMELEKDYIVVGSHAGNLSIFYPSPDWERNEQSGGYKATDLLLETRLNNPIIGVYSGKFSSNNRMENTNQLAILHPNSLGIFNLLIVDGVAEHGSQASLQLLLEHNFERAAFSFCMGHFGQVKGREFFCIVHLDGTLTFYEQDGISYECQFPGHRPLPAPVAYCERTDSFVRFSATWSLECFTYQDLCHSSMNKSQYQPVWTVSLGEGILDLCVVQSKKSSSSIMILGERNFIRLSDSGKIEFILKLDYAPKCFFSFVVGYYWEPNARLITAIVSESSKLYIYEDANIIWAAQLDRNPPVAIKRSNLNSLPGGIVTLGATGQLTIGYLGSESFTFTVPPLNIEEMNFRKAYKELLQLEEEIKESVDTGDREIINQRAADDVKVNFEISPEVSNDFDGLLLDVPADVAVKELPACKGKLKLKCKIALAEMQVSFNVPEGIRCSKDTLTYIDVEAGTTEAMDLDFFIADLLYFHTARVDCMVSFINTQGIPRVVQTTAYLPLEMFFKSRLPQKSATIKLTFHIDSKNFVPKPSVYFPEFVGEGNDSHALGLVLLCSATEKSEEIVTIVGAKNSNRVRVQSDSLEALPLILERLINVTIAKDNLNDTASKKAKQKNAMNGLAQSIKAAPMIPVQDILHRIDLHRETQENIRKQTILMDDLWTQFKTLQRKLQEKSDDEPKETLVMQIEQNYDSLIAEGDKLMEMKNEEKRHRCELSCAIAVANSLISCFPIEEKIIKIVSSVLCIPIEDWTEISWEESMLPGIDMLHHFGPLNRSKSNVPYAALDSNTSQSFFDYGRFRRHIATFFDRIIRLVTVAETEKSAIGDTIKEKPITPAIGLSEVLKTGNFVTENSAQTSISKERSTKGITLEAVEDDEDEYDGEDLRNCGCENESKNRKTSESSEWVNENFELPTSEELFSDLGIWW